MKKTIIVPILENPTRLDKFLVTQLSELSRTFIQQAIKDRKVTVNNKKIAVHHFLKNDDVIKIDILPPPIPKVKPSPKIKLNIIADTPDYIVIDKPEGLVVHPAPGIQEPTLADGLLAMYPNIKEVGDDPIRPGIIHRLDRDVSGLIVVAKTKPAFTYFKTQFKDRTIHKEYIALVVGEVAMPSGRIDFPLARSASKHGKIAARPKGEEGDEAITEFTVTKIYPHLTLLNISILTGRTHQIRAHLAAFGYPIVGDKIYKPTKSRLSKKIDRLFLHASVLEFNDLQGKRQKYISNLPKKLSDYLKTLS